MYNILTISVMPSLRIASVALLAAIRLQVAAENCAVNTNVSGVLDGSSLLQSKLGQMRTGHPEETSENVAGLSVVQEDAEDVAAPIFYYSPWTPATNPQRGMVIMEHKMVGCFPRSADDPSDLAQKYLDWSCVNSSTSPCHSGLPFFRLPLREGQSFLDCFSFCLSKGMDLFGVLAMDREGGDVEECRCGASKANLEAWHGNQPRPQLLLPSMGVDNDDPRCAMVVWQYTGGFENDGVPSHLMEFTQTELVYLDSITAGRMLSETEKDLHKVVKLPHVTTKSLLQTGASGVLAHKGLCQDGDTGIVYPDVDDPNTTENEGDVLLHLTCKDVLKLPPKFVSKYSIPYDYDLCPYVGLSCPVTCGVCHDEGSFLPCYPKSCGGMDTWQTKNSEGKVILNYFFDEASLSNRSHPSFSTRPASSITKSVFRLAAEAYPAHTCIELVEGTAETAPAPRIMVGFYDEPEEDSCWAKMDNGTVQRDSLPVKYDAQINLGFCNDAHHKGTMIHEIAHVMGMNHEQKRADAVGNITLPNGTVKGPHLIMHWEHITSEWVPQYAPESSTYIGSGDQGGDDPVVGYAPYDYESLMHYPRGDRISAVNPVFNVLIGQRTAFSEGDILQLNDMYQCSSHFVKFHTPAPTPPPTAAPTEAAMSSIGLVQKPTSSTVAPTAAAISYVQGQTSSTDAPTPAPTVPPTAATTEAALKLLPLLPTWNAGGWTSCQPRQQHLNQHAGHQWSGNCNAGCARTRVVTCKNTSTGVDFPDEASCPANAKLAESEVCQCSTTTCQDQCNPGFLSESGDVFVCSSTAVSYWCTHESAEDPLLIATVKERCPSTCGLCATVG